MSLFDQLVASASRNQSGLNPLRLVVEKELKLIPLKITDHRRTSDEFARLLNTRLKLVKENAARSEFIKEMRRFLPVSIAADTVEKPEFWQYLIRLIREECEQVL